LKFWIRAQALQDFTTSIDVNAFSQYLKEELSSTSKGSGLIDLSLENRCPASGKVLKGFVKVKINEMIEKIEAIEVGSDSPEVTN